MERLPATVNTANGLYAIMLGQPGGCIERPHGCTDRIAPGGHTAAEFREAAGQADAAVLLLSADFFDETRVQEEQWPALLAHHKDRGLHRGASGTRPSATS